jgi:hypothetical protein
MALQGNIQAAPDGSLGFDSDTVVSLAVAQLFATQGYTFCLRYLSRSHGQQGGDLSANEANNILAAGLALMPVQHVAKAGWSPTEALGQTMGANAASNAASIGFPAGVNVWCDLESVAEGSDPAEVIAYCNAWFGAVSAAGYVPGLYVGPAAGLDGQQLYDLTVEHYWKSASNVPALPERGYQMVQKLSPNVNGIGIDVDTTMVDQKGGAPIWLIQTP